MLVVVRIAQSPLEIESLQRAREHVIRLSKLARSFLQVVLVLACFYIVRQVCECSPIHNRIIAMRRFLQR